MTPAVDRRGREPSTARSSAGRRRPRERTWRIDMLDASAGHRSLQPSAPDYARHSGRTTRVDTAAAAARRTTATQRKINRPPSYVPLRRRRLSNLALKREQQISVQRVSLQLYAIIDTPGNTERPTSYRYSDLYFLSRPSFCRKPFPITKCMRHIAGVSTRCPDVNVKYCTSQKKTTTGCRRRLLHELQKRSQSS
uniref:Uncharacterized protein n=1 Tax=Plectus sambesii TaxID=2011161 RepID=A0A914UKV1_9BILA